MVHGILPGLVGLDLGIGGGLVLGDDGDVEDRFGVVSGCEMGNSSVLSISIKPMCYRALIFTKTF